MFLPQFFTNLRTKLPRCSVALCLLTLAGVAAAECPPPVQAPTPETMQRLQREARDRGFLWQIDKAGTTSWLYGSLHIGKEDWLIPGPKVMAALRSSQTVALELDPVDPATQQKLAALSTQGAGQIPAELQARVKKLMDKVCLPDTVMQQMHPAFLFAALELLAAREFGLEAGYGVEYVLSGAAHASGRPLVALETAESQVRALIGDSATVSPEELTEAIALSESSQSRVLVQRIARVWADSALNELDNFASWCECLTTEHQRAAMKRLLDDRNPALADAIDALHGQGKPVFVAIGSLHMAGVGGLPALLKQKGYTVTRIEFAPAQ